jgi:hypothetical protein
MSRSTVNSRLEKLENKAVTGEKKLMVAYSDLERANRVRVLLENRPHDATTERIRELTRIALQREEESL